MSCFRMLVIWWDYYLEGGGLGRRRRSVGLRMGGWKEMVGGIGGEGGGLVVGKMEESVIP